MSDPTDAQVRRLLHDAVDDVEPGERIALIREHTRTAPLGPWRRRTAIGGAVLATAAAVGAIAVLPQVFSDEGPGNGPVTSSTANQGVDRTPSAPPVDPTLTEPENPASVPAYFVGDTPRGPRLYRDFAVVDSSEPRLLSALRTLENFPGDPDYRSLWAPGSFVEATYAPTDRVITVRLADTSLADAPPGWSSREAQLAVQQAVYTAQGAVGEGRVPLQFRVDGEVQSTVFGVPTGNGLTNEPVLETLSLMNISYPFQGAEVNGGFTASGVANSLEANVLWRIENDSGIVVREGFTTAEGYLEPRLFPWETTIDVSDLPPGGYTFVASTEDPSGGAEGSGPDSDTRLIVIE